jgi:hypothetical protein
MRMGWRWEIGKESEKDWPLAKVGALLLRKRRFE